MFSFAKGMASATRRTGKKSKAKDLLADDSSLSILGFARRSFSSHPWPLLAIVATTLVASLLDGAGLTLVVAMADFLVGDAAGVDSPVLRQVESVFDGLGVSFTLRWIAVAIIVLMSARAVMLLAQRWVAAKAQATYEVDLRTMAFSSIMHAEWPFFLQRRTGDLINSLTTEARRCSGAFGNLANGIAALPNILIYLVLALFVSWPLTLIAGGFGALLMFGYRILMSIARRLGGAMSQANSDIVSDLSESIAGAKAIKSGATEGFVVKRFDEVARRLAHLQIRLGFNAGLLESTYDLGFIGIMAGGLLIAIRYLDIPAAATVLFALAFLRVYQRTLRLIQATQGLSQGLPAVERVHRTIAAAVESPEPTGAIPFNRLSNALVFESVSFGYATGNAVLEDVSMSIPSGSVTAFVGPSGVGKTTAVDLVMGLLQPSGGRVLVDGLDLNAYETRSWRTGLAYVSQDTVLFNDSIRNNIAWGREDVNDAEIVEAAKMAQAHDFIVASAQGYDATIGDRGVLLSGGQRQRICLARAFLRTPQLLILDEATSDLDVESEGRVLDALESIRGSATILMVAHRLSTVLAADHIYVFDHHTIVESGKPAELLERRGVFHRLYQQTLTPSHQ